MLIFDATAWTVRPDGSIYNDNKKLGWASTGMFGSVYYILSMTDYSRSQYGIDQAICFIDSGDKPASVAGATGQLTARAARKRSTSSSVSMTMFSRARAEPPLVATHSPSLPFQPRPAKLLDHDCGTLRVKGSFTEF